MEAEKFNSNGEEFEIGGPMKDRHDQTEALGDAVPLPLTHDTGDSWDSRDALDVIIRDRDPKLRKIAIHILRMLFRSTEPLS